MSRCVALFLLAVGSQSTSLIRQGPTGRAIIQLTLEGENAISELRVASFAILTAHLRGVSVLHRGANYAAHTDLASPNATLEYTHLLLQNEIPFASTLTFLSHAQTSDAISLYNPSPLPTDDQLRTFPWKSMARGWLLLNEGEAKGVYAALSCSDSVFGTEQTEDLEEEDPVKRAERLLLALHRHPAFSPHVNLVCTLGPHGAVALASSAGAENHDEVDESGVLHIPAAHLAGPVLDTTGAGDCFTGYFVAGLMDAHAEIQAQADGAGSRAIATETVWRALRRASTVRVFISARPAWLHNRRNS